MGTTTSTERSVNEASPRVLELKIMHRSADKLKEPPSRLFTKFLRLEKLELSHNRYQALPKAIGNSSFHQLRELYCGYNIITAIPVEIGNLIHLEVLCLTENHIKGVPRTIANLVHLKDLRLGGNRLDRISKSICSLTTLEWLDLDDNHIERIPRSIARLVNLQGLHLAVNNITTVPPIVSRLMLLEVLYLDDNLIEDLPDALSSLVRLKELGIQGNRLNILPRSMGVLLRMQVDVQIEGNPFSVEHMRLEQELGREIAGIEVPEELIMRERRSSHLTAELSPVRVPGNIREESFSFYNTLERMPWDASPLPPVE